MALTYEHGIVVMEPGPADMHGHPRALDPITTHDISGLNGYEGKAGLPIYTETALRSGIVVVGAMPNEFYRIIDPFEPDGTKIIQFPISNYDRSRIMGSSIRTQSRIFASYHLGVDPSEIIVGEQQRLDTQRVEQNFRMAGDEATALKLFGDFSTGGNNIPIEHFPEVISIWHKYHPNKPVIMHLEDAKVRMVLEQLQAEGLGHVPVHIAHVSSKEELSAVIEAKQRHQNVTCEVTPHHLFATAEAVELIDGYGCMRPTLKDADDVKFLWDNLKYIDIFASDCAPHKQSDKEAPSPTFGVTNHTTWLPLLFGAFEAGRLTLRDIEEKLIINPRKRFNLPEDDKTMTVFDLNTSYDSAEAAERIIIPRYGHNLFPKLEQLGRIYPLLGRLVFARSGLSTVAEEPDMNVLTPHFQTSLTHFVQPLAA